MSDITSVSGGGSSSLAALLNTKRPRTEATSQETGASDFASAICSFSNESLAKLSEAGQAGLDLVESGFDNTVEGIQDLGAGIVHFAEQGLDAVVGAAHSVESAVESTVMDVAHTVESAASNVAELWDDTVDAASEVAGAVTDGAEAVVDVVGAGARNVASYVALANSTVRSLLREFV